MGINPIINPPVGPKIIPIPPWNELKTGNPNIPKRIYKIIITKLTLMFVSKIIQKMAKVCKVNGIVKGIVIHEQIINIERNMDINAIDFVI